MDGMPQEVGPFRLDTLLGRGGMGKVYRAWDQRLKRWVAIKRLHDDEAPKTARARFLREARTAAGLGHPAILQIFDILHQDDTDWIVMEMVDGPTLAARLEDGPLAVDLAIDYARQVAGALAAAHANGVVHRDLKTENVMVMPSGHVKVLDFGLAKTLKPRRWLISSIDCSRRTPSTVPRGLLRWQTPWPISPRVRLLPEPPRTICSMLRPSRTRIPADR